LSARGARICNSIDISLIYARALDHFIFKGMSIFQPRSLSILPILQINIAEGTFAARVAAIWPILFRNKEYYDYEHAPNEKNTKGELE
jgi:hypothetical protein